MVNSEHREKEVQIKILVFQRLHFLMKSWKKRTTLLDLQFTSCLPSSSVFNVSNAARVNSRDLSGGTSAVQSCSSCTFVFALFQYFTLPRSHASSFFAPVLDDHVPRHPSPVRTTECRYGPMFRLLSSSDCLWARLCAQWPQKSISLQRIEMRCLWREWVVEAERVTGLSRQPLQVVPTRTAESRDCLGGLGWGSLRLLERCRAVSSVWCVLRGLHSVSIEPNQ